MSTTSSSNSALKMRDICLHYGERKILNKVNLSISFGEIVAIMGESGSGKTSILNTILGSVKATGSCQVAGSEVIGTSRKTLSLIRSQKLGIVFQHGELLEELTPLENVALAALISGTQRDLAAKAAEELLQSLGIPNNGVATGDLSGGERQRTALARALINRPPLVLADEPTGSLDESTRDEVLSIMFSTLKESGSSMLLVTHDQVVASHADRLFHLIDGKLAEVVS